MCGHLHLYIYIYVYLRYCRFFFLNIINIDYILVPLEGGSDARAFELESIGTLCTRGTEPPQALNPQPIMSNGVRGVGFRV